MKRNTQLVIGTFALAGVCLALALVLSAPYAARAAGTVRYAKPGGLTTGNCDSWSNACTLQRALAVAVSGDEIWVQAGVHYPGAAGNRNTAFVLKSGVALYGGFAGTESTRDARNWQVNRTILSGDIDQNDVTDGGVVTSTANIVGANAYHVISSTNVSNAVLDGFIVTAGQADDTVLPHNSGGGMYNYASSPALANVTFSGNRAVSGGGMFNTESSHPTLTNVTLIGNSADRGGGMLNEVSSNPTLTNVAFISNTVTILGGGMLNREFSSPTLMNVVFISNTADYGGGMHNRDSSNPTLVSVTFRSNVATSGGGMYNYNNSNPVLTDVTFSGNKATEGGGGMCNHFYSSPTLTNVDFSGNSAEGQGGGMYNFSFTYPTLTNVAFISNTATLYGGAMYNYGSSPTLMNVVFISNTAQCGGGMINTEYSSPILTNVTFSNNSADWVGGMMNYVGSNPRLTNVILWGDSAPNDAEIYNWEYSTPVISYSNIRGCGGSGTGWQTACGTDGGHNIAADPRFVNAAGGNLRLDLTSPCIDAGNNAAVLAGVTTDLDGNPRFVDIPTVPNTGSGTPPIVDMGAYETQQQQQQADVALTKTVSPDTATPGQTITFTLAISNIGNITATNIVVTDTLPSFLSGVTINSSLIVTNTGHIPPYVWTVQDLAPGQSGVITIHGVLTVPLAAGTYSNTAVIAAKDDPPAGNNATATLTVSNVAPVFTSTPITIAASGVRYTYTATARDNNGDAVTITAPTHPAWLTLTAQGNGNAILSGTPTNAHLGQHTVVLQVTDQQGLYTQQEFVIRVTARIYLPLVLKNTR